MMDYTSSKSTINLLSFVENDFPEISPLSYKAGKNKMVENSRMT